MHSFTSMQVNVVHAGKELLSLRASKVASIASLKQSIAETTQIPDAHQSLAYRGTILSDILSLDDCQLEDGVELELLIQANYALTMQIGILLPGGNTLPLQVGLTDTVADVKHQCQIVTGHEGMNHRLCLGSSREMQNEKRLLDYEVTEGCLLYLLPVAEENNIGSGDSLIMVHFITPKTTLSKRVNPNFRLCDAIGQLEEVGGMDRVDRLFVNYSGQQVDIYKTFLECGIEEGDSVFVGRKRQGIRGRENSMGERVEHFLSFLRPGWAS